MWIINKIKAAENQSEPAQLINVHGRYKKRQILIYRMKDQTQNNQPTFVLKTLLVSLQIAENMRRGKNHYLGKGFAWLNGKKIGEIKNDCPYIAMVSSSIEKTNQSCYDGSWKWK